MSPSSSFPLFFGTVSLSALRNALHDQLLLPKMHGRIYFIQSPLFCAENILSP